MKKFFVFAILSLVLVSMNSCIPERITGSGTITSENRTVSNTNFTEIRVEGSMNVSIKQGDSVKIVAKDFANLLPYLETRIVGNTLVIDYRDHSWISNSVGEVTVTMPKLSSVELSGSGNIGTIGSFRFDDLSLLISGSGNFSFAGSAKNMNAKITGSGNIRTFDMPTENATVKITGSGDMQVNVTRLLDATITGSGDIVYKGTPSVNSSVTGSGRIKRF
jgi:Putative auto-transporter adhesin, head GIN domain